MASFGKLTAALMSASQENTLALANLNFDFALIKCEAPVEYQGLGIRLSKKRRDTAEDGPLHITARKLTALFESEIPRVPHLIQAYGKRSSEIAEMPSINPQPSRSDGVFADFIGADGATIWATATSGEGAITMHLLACFLARIWNRSEAVSIWSELVEERKEILRRKTLDHGATFQITEAIASRIEITRDQLANWDASARAWLHTADEAKKLQQTQLKLVLDNISLPVSTEPKLYSAIIESWTVSMRALDNLIQGSAQRIQSGEVLLGLSAWHLYPDISVLDTKQHHIQQNDLLISPGGIITIGMKNRPDLSDEGIYWSLPLAHMRFYGDPVMATRRTGLRESQITFDQFQAVVLGSVLSSWNWWEQDLTIPLEILDILGRALSEEPSDLRFPGESLYLKFPDKRSYHEYLKWLSLLSETARTLLGASGAEKEQLLRLVHFGRRRCGGFLSDSQARPSPVFGLTGFSSVLGALNTVEEKLEFLRKLAAARFPRSLLGSGVIRYGSSGEYQYYSLGPTHLRRKKRSRGEDPDPRMPGVYLAWLDDDNSRGNHVRVKKKRGDSFRIPPGPQQRPEAFQFLCGTRLCGIYIPISRKRGKWTTDEELFQALEANHLPVKEFHAYLGADLRVAKELLPMIYGSMEQANLPEYFDSKEEGGLSKYFDSLDAFARSHEIYSGLSGARVDLHITGQSMCSKWWLALKEKDISLGITFSCIALFETGHLDIDPESLKEAMALSCDNSIFVASALLFDPLEADVRGITRRITGNIGKPGFAILIPPSNPKVKEVDCRSWNAVEHEPFDGRLLDCFAASSLHLSLTGYELALDVGQRGARDHDCFFVETAVSLFDRGEWIADLDVIKSQSQWRNGAPIPSCHHDKESPIGPEQLAGLVSIDSWVEFLDPPLSNCIVRSRGNTMARLAAASLAAQRGYPLKIIPSGTCLSCVLSHIKDPAQMRTESDEMKNCADNESDCCSSSDSSSSEDVDSDPMKDAVPLPPLFPDLDEDMPPIQLEQRSEKNEGKKAFWIC